MYSGIGASKDSGEAAWGGGRYHLTITADPGAAQVAILC